MSFFIVCLQAFRDNPDLLEVLVQRAGMGVQFQLDPNEQDVQEVDCRMS